MIDPVTLLWAEGSLEKGSAADRTDSPRGKSSSATTTTMSFGLRYDFDAKEGSVSVVGRSEKTDDVLKAAGVFGKQLNRGWEWTGQTSANLQRNWGNPDASGWNGQAEFLKGELQIAGLNQPVKVKAATLRWRQNAKSVGLQSVEAFGGEWDGEISENLLSGFTAGAAPRWRFRLHGDTLSATDMDRWMGPRARPGWLQRLLPAMLGGSTGQPADVSELLRRVDAEGDLSIDEFALEKLKVKQLATFDPKPLYELKLRATGIALAQVPLAGKVADRVAGTLDGTLDLKTEGVGREALLDKLTGEGHLQLKKIEFRGWDVPASFAAGVPHVGVSRWTDGDGVFHVSARSVEVNHLQLRAPQEEISLKGSVSFGREADLTLDSVASSKAKTPRPERVMQISGPLEGPRVAIQTVAPQQPGD